MIAAELGTAEGNYSRDLLAAGIVKLYMVDIYDHIPKVKGDANSPKYWHDANYQKAKQQVKPFGEKAVFLKGRTVAMAAKVPDDSLGLLYLDADHSFEGVMADLNAWFPKVVKGGVIAMHDFENSAYGVKEAAQDFTKNRFELIPLPEDKEEDAGAYFLKQPL